MEIDQEKFDEIVLALLFYNSWKEKIGQINVFQAWKSLDWDALSRLSQKGLIGNPKSKAKSIVLTDKGYALAQELFEKHFGRDEKLKLKLNPDNAERRTAI